MPPENGTITMPAAGQIWRELETERRFAIYTAGDAFMGSFIETPGEVFTFEPAEFIGRFEFISDGRGPIQHPAFPVATLNEALAYLRRPFTKEAIRFKVQTVFKEAKGCIVVGYIDARLVYERLNHVVGANWSDDYEPLQNELMLCRLTVDGVTRQNVGSGYKGKGLYSDALKRTAVAFGIGISVYALPQITLFEDAVKKGHLERFTGKQGPSLRLTDKGHAALRSGYEKWLHETGVPQFGQPIDHGDVEDSAGEEPEAIAASEEVSDLPAVKQPLTDDKADTLRNTCRSIYESVDKRKLPKARFDAELKQASVSHDELEAFAVRLREMA